MKMLWRVCLIAALLGCFLLSHASEHKKRKGEEVENNDRNANSNIKVKRNYTTAHGGRSKATTQRKTFKKAGSKRISTGPRSDIGCVRLGGICQPSRYICQGRYLKDKCSGTKTRQCCMPVGAWNVLCAGHHNNRVRACDVHGCGAFNSKRELVSPSCGHLLQQHVQQSNKGTTEAQQLPQPPLKYPPTDGFKWTIPSVGKIYHGHTILPPASQSWNNQEVQIAPDSITDSFAWRRGYRGNGLHKAVDLVCDDYGIVNAPFSGSLAGPVSRKDPAGNPYDGVKLLSDVHCVKIFNIRPYRYVGPVAQGEALGYVLPLQEHFSGITSHLELRLCDGSDPSPFI